MSDDVLKLIPEAREFLPPREAAEKARILLEDFFPDGEQAEVEFSETLQFRDGGQNIEKVRCPSCQKTTDIDPFRVNDIGTAWWYEFDDALSGATDLRKLSVKMPCCGKAASVQDIDFGNAADFSRFELCIWNPSAENGISAEQVAIIEELLGCKLKQIWAHY
jgi:hypothetical protein